MIVLKGDRQGLINNLSVPYLVSPGYAPEGRSLISVSVLGDQRDTPRFAEQARSELVEWFGKQADRWDHLRTQHIRRALPVGPPGNDSPMSRTRPVFVCGDYTTSGLIEGAVRSGLRIDELVLAEREKR